MHVQFGHALDPMLVSLEIEGVRAEFVMATIESDVFPPGEVLKTDKVKTEPRVGSAKHGEVGQGKGKVEGKMPPPEMTGKRKRTSLALIEGQQETEGGGASTQNGQRAHASQLGHREQVEAAPLAPGPSQQPHAAEPEYDLDFQPNGMLDPMPDLDAPPREAQPPLFFSQGDNSDDEKTAQRQALQRQSQAEVDALNPEELAQLMDDDPDITMDDNVEETFLGPTQPAAVDEDDVVPESGKRSVSCGMIDLSGSLTRFRISIMHCLMIRLDATSETRWTEQNRGAQGWAFGDALGTRSQTPLEAIQQRPRRGTRSSILSSKVHHLEIHSNMYNYRLEHDNTEPDNGHIASMDITLCGNLPETLDHVRIHIHRVLVAALLY